MGYRRARARARYTNGRVTLLAGSTISAPVHASLSDALRDLRRDLRRKGKLVEVSPDLFRLDGIHTFGSPSGAAQFVAGASVSGNRDWKVAGKGISLGDWLSQKGARD